MARISSDPIANYRGHIGKISYYMRGGICTFTGEKMQGS